MHIRNARDIDPVSAPHGEIIFELFGSTTGGGQAHSLAQIVIPPGKASRRHFHPEAEESYYVLSGVGALIIDGEAVTLNTGDGVVIPPPQIHQIANQGTENLVLLVVCVPAWTPDNSVFLD